MRTLFTICLLTMSFCLYGQKKQSFDSWLERQKTEYSADKYYTGFSSENLKKDQSKQDILDRLKKSADLELSGKIYTQINSITTDSITNNNEENGNVTSTGKFTSISTIITITETVGREFEIYDESGVLGIFAYVSRQELTEHYAAMIGLKLDEMEAILNNLNITGCKNGEEKVKAIRKITNEISRYEPSLRKSESEIKKYTEWLVTVGKNENMLQKIKSKLDMLKEKERMLSDFSKQKISIYVESKETFLGDTVSTLLNKTKEMLSKLNCKFENSPVNADFILKIAAETQEIYIHNTTGYSIEGRLELYNNTEIIPVNTVVFEEKQINYTTVINTILNEIQKKLLSYIKI